MLIINMPLLFSQIYIPTTEEFPEINTEQEDAISTAVEGIINITSSIISDTFVPMTHSEKGDLYISAVPAYCDVDVVSESNNWKGKDLIVNAFGTGAGYALTDSLLLYGIASGIQIDGNIYTDGYSGDAEFTLAGICTGLGYDLIKDNSKLSIPVFAGIYIQNYNTTVDLTIDAIDDEINTINTNYSAFGSIDDYSVKTEGNGILYGCTLAAAVSYKFNNNKRITPYVLYSKNLNNTEIDTTVSGAFSYSGVPIIGSGTQYYSNTASTEVSDLEAAMFGLNMSYAPTEKLDFSLSVGGLLSSTSGFYNDTFLDGLKLTTIALVVTYKK